MNFDGVADGLHRSDVLDIERYRVPVVELNFIRQRRCALVLHSEDTDVAERDLVTAADA